MDTKDRRRFKRYDAFIQLTFFVPISLDRDAFELTGWIKDVSQNGVALEVYIFSPDEIKPLLNIVENKERITVSIPLPDDSVINEECKIVRGAFSERKRLYTLGLQVLAIDPFQKHKWESFIEKLF